MNNVEEIIEHIKMKDVEINKYDGITIACKVPTEELTDKAIQVLKTKLTKLGVAPVSVEKNKIDKNQFMIQFPDFDPVYTDEEISKIYVNSFDWLIENLTINDGGVKPTLDLLLSNKDIMTKQAITIFYRSCTNRYRYTLYDYLNNIEYRDKIDNLYMDYLMGANNE